jgi:Na+(H+)/acetate symporter ActP
MILLHLASALGGEVLFGLLASVAFTTILAVVAGLTIALSASAAHDIYDGLSRKGEHISERRELVVFRVSAVAATLVGTLLAIMLREQNVTLLAVLAFSIAASTNFPVLILTLYWRGLTSTGAILGGLTGLVLSVALMIVGPTMWVAVLGNPEPLFPTDYGTLIATPAALFVAWLISVLGRHEEKATQPA